MDKYDAIVVSLRHETPDVVSILFTLADGAILDYDAGQYITVYFDQTSKPEGKAYSLSSAPGEKPMSITVKRIGEYSKLLHNLKKGDTFKISRPYGFFNPATPKPLVCIAAGVGLAPIWSIIKHEHAQGNDKPVFLYYSNKTTRDISFSHELEAQHEAHINFQLIHHITRSPRVPAHMIAGRINLDRCVQVVDDPAYLICGSVDFVRSMHRGLVKRGVGQGSISTEIFFEL